MLVVDTSVALKWMIQEQGSAEALGLFSHALLAPDLIQAEYGNVLTKKVRRREIAPNHAGSAFNKLLDLVTMVPSPRFAISAFEMSLRLEHAIYDCYFLALAEAQGTFVITADQLFVGKVRRTELAPLILLLGEEVPDV